MGLPARAMAGPPPAETAKTGADDVDALLAQLEAVVNASGGISTAETLPESTVPGDALSARGAAEPQAAGDATTAERVDRALALADAISDAVLKVTATEWRLAEQRAGCTVAVEASRTRLPALALIARPRLTLAATSPVGARAQAIARRNATLEAAGSADAPSAASRSHKGVALVPYASASHPPPQHETSLVTHSPRGPPAASGPALWAACGALVPRCAVLAPGGAAVTALAVGEGERGFLVVYAGTEAGEIAAYAVDPAESDACGIRPPPRPPLWRAAAAHGHSIRMLSVRGRRLISAAGDGSLSSWVTSTGDLDPLGPALSAPPPAHSHAPPVAIAPLEVETWGALAGCVTAMGVKRLALGCARAALDASQLAATASSGKEAGVRDAAATRAELDDVMLRWMGAAAAAVAEIDKRRAAAERRAAEKRAADAMQARRAGGVRAFALSACGSRLYAAGATVTPGGGGCAVEETLFELESVDSSEDSNPASAHAGGGGDPVSPHPPWRRGRRFGGHRDKVFCLLLVDGDPARRLGLGDALVTGSLDGAARVFDLDDNKSDGGSSGEAVARLVLRGHGGGVRSLCLPSNHGLENHGLESRTRVRDPPRLYTGSADHTIRVWDVGIGACLRAVACRDSHGGYVAALWVRDSEITDSGVSDSEVSDGRALAVRGSGRVSPPAPLPQATIVSGGTDGALKSWSAADGTCLGTWAGHDSDLGVAAIATADDVIVTGGGDGAVRLWGWVAPSPGAGVCAPAVAEAARASMGAGRPAVARGFLGPTRATDAAAPGTP